MMTENRFNISSSVKNNKHTTKKSMCNLNETYRVTVAVVGRCGLPTVGIPLFLP
jgi:hypothetical protein